MMNLESRGRKKRILVADKSLTIQKVVQLSLATMDAELLMASEGHEAVQKVRRYFPDIALISADLPERDGLSVLQEIKSDSALKAVRVVLLVGPDFDPIRELPKDKKRQPDRLLSKPFDSKMLLRALSKVDKTEVFKAQVAEVLSEDSDFGLTEKEQTEITRKTNTDKIEPRSEEVRVVQDRETKIIRPEDFREPVRLSQAEGSSEAAAENLLKQWIAENLPTIAERIIKEELSKLKK